MTESDEQKIHSEEIKKKQMDKQMREKGIRGEEYDHKVVNDPSR
jgi:hypothetical protein